MYTLIVIARKISCVYVRMDIEIQLLQRWYYLLLWVLPLYREICNYNSMFFATTNFNTETLQLFGGSAESVFLQEISCVQKQTNIWRETKRLLKFSLKKCFIRCHNWSRLSAWKTANICTNVPRNFIKVLYVHLFVVSLCKPFRLKWVPVLHDDMSVYHTLTYRFIFTMIILVFYSQNSSINIVKFLLKLASDFKCNLFYVYM